MGEGAGEDSICRLNGLMSIFDDHRPLTWMKFRCDGCYGVGGVCWECESQGRMRLFGMP